MNLSERDKAIMNFIRKQDFCFYKDVIKVFSFLLNCFKKIKRTFKIWIFSYREHSVKGNL